MIGLEIEIVGADADFDAIHLLLHDAFAYMEGRIDPPSSLYRLSPADLADKAARGACLIARLGQELVGCVFVEDHRDRLYVGKLAVDPDHQGQGIGAALMQATEMVAQSLGRPALELETRIELTENHRAFAALGFEQIGETAHPGYERATSITMRKVLG